MYSPANPRSDELKWFSAVQNDFSVVVACYLATLRFNGKQGQYSLSYSPTYRGAFLASWGSRKCDIRSSRCFGQAKSKLKLKEDLIPHKEVLVTGKHSNYILVFNDCQIFSRSVIDYLTGR